MRSLYEKRVKRSLDLLGASLGLVLTLPLTLGAGLAVRITMGSPVLYKQERPGLHEVGFTVLKFRTMREGNGADEERLTPVGRFLRQTSIDELPQMINILRGDMSFVGPRPLASQYLGSYTKQERRRHMVKPGITGLAQINGRNSVRWEDRFRHDVRYVDSISLPMDARILFATVLKTIRRENIGFRGAGGVEDFDRYRERQAISEQRLSDNAGEARQI